MTVGERVDLYKYMYIGVHILPEFQCCVVLVMMTDGILSKYGVTVFTRPDGLTACKKKKKGRKLNKIKSRQKRRRLARMPVCVCVWC